MSDKAAKKKHNNYDLERAEQKLIAAGQPEFADAMYDYAQGIRNYVQGDFGQSFLTAYEHVLSKHIEPLEQTMQNGVVNVLASVQQSLDIQHDLVQQLVTMSREANARLGKVEKAVIILKKGQTASDKQLATVMKELAQLGALAEKTNFLVEEHNRIAAEQIRLDTIANDLAARVAKIEAWQASQTHANQ